MFGVSMNELAQNFFTAKAIVCVCISHVIYYAVEYSCRYYRMYITHKYSVAIWRSDIYAQDKRRYFGAKTSRTRWQRVFSADISRCEYLTLFGVSNITHKWASLFRVDIIRCKYLSLFGEELSRTRSRHYYAVNI